MNTAATTDKQQSKADCVSREGKIYDGGFLNRLIRALACNDCPSWMKAAFLDDAEELRAFVDSEDLEDAEWLETEIGEPGNVKRVKVLASEVSLPPESKPVKETLLFEVLPHNGSKYEVAAVGVNFETDFPRPSGSIAFVAANGGIAARFPVDGTTFRVLGVLRS